MAVDLRGFYLKVQQHIATACMCPSLLQWAHLHDHHLLWPRGRGFLLQDFRMGLPDV